jgi:hypothetical protein
MACGDNVVIVAAGGKQFGLAHSPENGKSPTIERQVGRLPSQVCTQQRIGQISREEEPGPNPLRTKDAW